MTWIATDNFDSYSAGASINGASGGSGWSGNWSLAGGVITTETAPAGGQGGLALRTNPGTGVHVCGRALTGISKGICSFRLYSTTTTPNDFVGILLRESGSGRMYVRLNGAQIQLFNGGTASYQNIQAFSANTWYTIDIEFDDAAQNNQYRVRVNGGSWTSWVNTNGAYTSINEFRVDKSATTSMTFWVDDIKNGEPPVEAGGFWAWL